MFNFPAKTDFKRLLLIHAGFWLLFVLAELSYVYAYYHAFGNGWGYLTYYTIYISLFYGQLGLLGYRFRWQKYVAARKIGLFLVLVSAYLACKMTAQVYLEPQGAASAAPLHNIYGFLSLSLFRGGYFLFLATFYWGAGQLSRYQQRIKDNAREQQLQQSQMEKLLAESRNAYLQQQVNPHFLFNALNLVYSSIYPHTETGGRAVYLLTEIMRFNLAVSAADEKVKLQDELDQVINLLEINALRFDQSMYINVELGELSREYRVIPLILLTLTENIFKHGNLHDPVRPAELKIGVTGDELVFYSRNLKKKNILNDLVSGTGLRNARTRLDFVYGDNYRLTVDGTGDFFELSLSLPV